MPGIYIHIPFCRQACHYCNFHFSVSKKLKPQFVTALLSEIAMQKDFFKEMETDSTPPIDTLYLGGGTPSLLSDDELGTILGKINRHFHLKTDAEITIESNPDDLNPSKLTAFKELGINRLSIGIQSFYEHDLKYMNRSHTSQQAHKVLEEAIAIGFNNITADLIYGTPGMTDQQWIDNIETLTGYGIPHISAYALTVEKKTALDLFIRQGKSAAVDDDQAARQFEILMERLTEKGFKHYEISNFGLPDFFSQHNLGYWSGQPYLGLGPSAHSFKPGMRMWNIANTSGYIKSIQNHIIPFEQEILTADQQYNEYVMTSLRTMWGIEKQKVEDLFGNASLHHLIKQARQFIEFKTLADTGSNLVITPKGRFLSDGISAALFK